MTRKHWDADQWLWCLEQLAESWARDAKTSKEAVDGMVHSILVMVDGGGSYECPQIDLKFYGTPTPINRGVVMHEMWGKRRMRRKS